MTTKNGAIIALLCYTGVTAITLNQEHRSSIDQQGIFGKMIEMATAGEKSDEEKHAGTLRK